MTGTSAPPIRRPGGRIRSLATVFAVLATLFASLTLVAPAPASAAGNGEWSVDPYVPEGTSQNARRYFFLEGAAGTTVPDVVTLHNTSPTPLTMKLFGADAYNTPRDGGFALRTVTDKQKDVGTWIQVAPENQTLILQPGEKRNVPFNIVIPPNATPGDHPGAVVALNTAIEGTQQQGQIKVNIQRQIGARVYLRVQGDALPAMDIQKVDVKRDAGFHEFFGSSTARITYRIINRGNVILRPKFDLKAEGLFGRKLMSKADEGTEILPGSTVEKVVEWQDAPRLDHVTIKVDGVVADQNLKDSASASYTAVPWPSLLTLAAILLIAGVGWGVWRNGRKGKGGADPAKPGGPTGPTDGTTMPEPAAAAGAAVAHAETSGEPIPAETPTPTKPAKADAVVGTSGTTTAVAEAEQAGAAVGDSAAAESAESAHDAPPVANATATAATSAEGGPTANPSSEAPATEQQAEATAAKDGPGAGEPAAAEPGDAVPAANEGGTAAPSAEDLPSVNPIIETPTTTLPAEARPAEVASAAAQPDTTAETDPVEPGTERPAGSEPPAEAESAAVATTADRPAEPPNGKQPPAPSRAAPAVEGSADSAGVGR
ncbi:WxL protein peptidoglycan domain-containing protein [Embleya sp. AB8]|uniref:WxL protein peptidoglycan domain-containing protein n=1 Tax=Embleya sp. AB8 TaxID=3156304 RepID=UPI003C73C77E